MAIDYVAHLLTDADLFAAAVERGPIDAPVSGCPRWELRRLAAHLGFVHRWATQAASTGVEVVDPRFPPPSDDELAGWIRDGAGRLAEVLRGLDPEAPTWHLFPVARVARVWPRRQAHETVIHRWDAEQAVGTPSPIDPELAADGIDEYWEVMLPRLMAKAGVELPASSFHVHCTDTVPGAGGEWTVRAVDGALEMRREHAKGDAALRGRAEDVLLALWGRPVPVDRLDIVGDADAARNWLALGGV